VFAENLAMKLIGLVTTLIILGAIYLFFVKPVIDTTNNAFDSVNDSLDTAFDDFGVEGVNVDEIKNGNFNEIQQQLQDSGLSGKDQKQAEKLLHCIQRVQPDTDKMQACADRYG
jgi:hypothetical protein